MATKMTASEITERINKAEEAVEKKKKSIARLEKEIANWTGSEYMKEVRQDDLSRRNQELQDKEKTLQNWKKKLEEVNDTDKVIREIPEQLHKLMEQIREEMIKDRTQYRDTMKKDYAEMERKEFIKKYKYTDFYKVYYQTDEDIAKEARRDSKYYIIDLVQRVTKKVGEITKWELWDAGSELNGWVWGTRGSAKIETILAGGYNVQCLHTRVLVK